MNRSLQEVVRFLVVGAANTIATGSIFYALAAVLPSSVAYTIAFGLGVVFSTAVTPRFVFLSRPPMGRRAAYAGWYVVVYLVGLLAVFVLGDILALDRLPVVVFTVTGTALLSFLGARLLFSDHAQRGRP